MFVTGLCFLGVTVTVRYVGTDLPAAQAAFLRYVIGTLLLLPAFMRLASGDLVIRQPWVMIVRGVAHGIGVILWFYAMARIPIAEVTALGYLTPVVVTVAAAIFLGETLHARRLIAVLAGFVGVMIIIRPGLQEISIGQLAQLATAPMFAISMLLTKKLTASNEPIAIVAVLSLVCTLTLLPPAVMLWVAPGIDDLILLTLTAVLATVGHYTMTLAFSYAPLSALQPISFLQLIWATLAGICCLLNRLMATLCWGESLLLPRRAILLTARQSLAGRARRPFRLISVARSAVSH